MKKVSHNAPKVKAIHKDDATPETPLEEELGALDTRIALIQALIPLGLDAVAEELQEEVSRLAGDRYTRKDTQNPNRRWGSQQGSVYLSDQKVPLSVPRVRNVVTDEEVSLQTYHHLQRPRRMDEGLLLRMIKGIATRSYQACAEAIPKAFGLSSSTVSRRFIKASAEKLKQFRKRSLAQYDLVALFIDGKTFADQEMIIALGVTIEGDKIPLGFVQAATENERVCRQFIRSLLKRDLVYHKGLLCLIDGSKGLYAALTKALSGYVVIQRCQWHKRENVSAYLPKGKQDEIKKALQHAYDLPTYQEAKAALDALKPELALMNESAQNSLEEGLEETLTLHRLGLMPQLKQSFRTTNCIESLNSMVAQLTRNVKRWTNSNQRSRWLATALLDIEPRLRRVKGFRSMPRLRRALVKDLKLDTDWQDALAAD
jgi:putative transposase